MNGAGVIALLAQAAPAAELDAWLRLLGRLHPVLIHFPVALAICAAVAEAARAARGKPGCSEFAIRAVTIAAAVGVVTATSGWLQADFEGAEATPTLFVHRWLGVICAALLVAVAVCGHLGSRNPRSAAFGLWRVGLALAAVCVAGAGHFGGEMVYGDGYLEKALWKALRLSEVEGEASPVAPAPLAPVAPVVASSSAGSTAVAAPLVVVQVEPAVTPVVAASPDDPSGRYFNEVIRPIVTGRCFECHSNKKAKDGLNFESLGALATKISAGGPIHPHDPAASPIIIRLRMDSSDEDAMPPEGDRLSAVQIDQVAAWIAAGARIPLQAADDGQASAPAATGPAAPDQASGGHASEG